MEATRKLIAELTSPMAATREAAAQRLASMGEGAVPDLASALETLDEAAVCEIIKVLGKIAGPRSLALIERCLERDSVRVKTLSAMMLSRNGDASVVPSLEKALCLGIGGKSREELLLIYWASMGLARLGYPGPMLAEALRAVLDSEFPGAHDTWPFFRADALRTSVEAGFDEPTVAYAYLKNPWLIIRFTAAKLLALNGIREQGVVEVLKEAVLQKNDPGLCSEAAGLLEKLQA